MEEGAPVMRCDLHVHSVHSGPADLSVLARFGNECYSEPEAVYDAARSRGMNLVTLTDHDSIAGALRLAHHADVFVSEEVTCTLPGGRALHLGVYDITESQHHAIVRRRSDAEALFAYLAEQRIPAAVNHLFSALTGRRAVADFHLPLSRLDLIEAQNGMMPPRTNAFARAVGRRAGLSLVGGSDAHTLASVASAWTEVRDARDRRDFLDGLRRGLTIPAGTSGSYARLTADVVRVFAAGYRDAALHCADDAKSALRFAVMLAGSPILALIPVVTAAIYCDELIFAVRHHRLYQASKGLRLRTPRVRGPFGPAPATTPLG